MGKLRPQSITYSQAVDLFLQEKRKSRRPRTAGDYQWLLSRVPFKGQLTELTHQELQRRLARIAAEGTYNHVLVALKVFFNWAIKRRYIEHNPTLGLAAHARAPRSRVLTDAELQSIWRACERRLAFDDGACGGFQTTIPDTVTMPRQFATIVQLLLLTGQRRGEIAALRADYISNDVCTLPSTLTKNGREHSLPLGSFAISIVSAAAQISQSGLLFRARGAQSAFNGWSKSKAALDKLSAVSDWTLHDLRRTFATRLAELGVAPHVIERLLNHVTGTVSGVAAVYNRASYMAEMRAAIELWERYLEEKVMCGEQPGPITSASGT
ncbi:tyrosine-type recombinase/integrase [Nitrobacter sp. TKz-YC01]|uniref:tyrosine-type recombinase/integrase n=1 Tax=Nitrobacter sp. TKz-YC01 TaxID=3398703 RepID=UPI003A0FC17E